MNKKLQQRIEDRRKKGTLRSLSSFEGMVDFASNDYLGLAKEHSKNKESSGGTGSRLISGNSPIIEEVEQGLADFFEAEAALCFNSGYDANIGLFSSIPQRGDIILYDELIHASVRDGIRLSLAKSYRFKHNDPDDLERLLIQFEGKVVYIACEGLYSMNGDLAPLPSFVELTKQYGAYLILDEAHSGGVFGDQGRGLACAVNLQSDVFIRLITFGKAYGMHGSVVLCSAEVKEYLVNFARSFIYTTALPVASYVNMLDVVHCSDIDHKRFQLQSNISVFRNKLIETCLISESNSPIQIVQFPSLDHLKRAECDLKEKMIYAKAIYPPTVPEGEECLRICLHSYSTLKEIDELCAALIQFIE